VWMVGQEEWRVVGTSRSAPHQQNLDTKRIAVLIVRARSNRIQDLLTVIPECLVALDSIQPRQVVRVGSLSPR
jgi:hypothetical protein